MPLTMDGWSSAPSLLAPADMCCGKNRCCRQRASTGILRRDGTGGARGRRVVNALKGGFAFRDNIGWWLLLRQGPPPASPHAGSSRRLVVRVARRRSPVVALWGLAAAVL